MIALLAALLIAYAPQQAGSEPLPADLEARVQVLGKQLRCAVCQGVAISDSPAQMARAQLDRVRELVAEGRTDAEVRDYFVARYGEWVLLEPPRHGINWLVWGGPVLLLVVGGALVVATVRRKGSRPESPAPAANTSAAESDPYRAAIRAELERR